MQRPKSEPPELERYVEDALTRDVEARGGYCLKVVMLGRRSFPDRLVLLPGRRPFLVETKRRGEVPTAKQRRLHAQLEAFGLPVLSWDGEEIL